MLDHAVMKSVAEQLMSGSEVVVGGWKSRVRRTGSRRFRKVRFVAGGEEYQAIEQNSVKAEPLGGSWRVKENAWCSFAIWNRTSYVTAVGRMLQFYCVCLTSPGDYHYSAAET